MAGSSNVFMGNGQSKVIIGNNAKVKFGSQCKIYLSCSAASENAATAPTPSNPPTATPLNSSSENLKQALEGVGLILLGTLGDEAGIGELIQAQGVKMIVKTGASEVSNTAEAETATAVSEDSATAKATPSAETEPTPVKQPKQCQNPPPKIFENNAKHIFRDRKQGGHFIEDTPENRQKLIDTASNPDNYKKTDEWGKDIYAETQPDGTEIWVEVKDGQIRNGGINDVTRYP